MKGNWTNFTDLFFPSGLEENSTERTQSYTLAESALIGLFLAIIIFTAIVGNVLVCAAVFTDRHLKRTSNYYIVSLGVADLLVALMVMTFAVVNDISGRWHFGQTFCSIWISSDVMCSTASILNLCVISLDRYIHIRDPLRYDRWMTTRKAVLIILAVWCCSALISFLPIHLKWHNPNADMDPIDRDASICVLNLSPVYAVVSSTISFIIPCIVMLSIYFRLYRYAQKHVRSIRKQTFTPERVYGTTVGGKQSGYKVSDHKAAVTLGVIMGVFLFCWFPFFCINIIAAFCSTCVPPLLFIAFTWLGYVNSALNPIIYSIFNQEFRHAFRKLLFPRACVEYCSQRKISKQKTKSNANKSLLVTTFEKNGLSNNCQQSKDMVTEKITAL